jgi:hypothetical protein
MGIMTSTDLSAKHLSTMKFLSSHPFLSILLAIAFILLKTVTLNAMNSVL